LSRRIGDLQEVIVISTRRFLLQIPHPHFDAMIAHALADLPNECCGLLAGNVDGTIGIVEQHYRLINELHSAAEFVSEPKSMFAAVKDMRRRRIDVLAVYHSHPSSAPIPSRRDLERNYSVDVMNLIVGLKESPEVRAWWLDGETFVEAVWECAGSSA
jgi:proteasome lid subunit RPN8/RPN11